MFHALPPSAESDARARLAAAAKDYPPPRAIVAGVMDLGGGVALRVVSDDLDAIRRELADHFHGLLSAQDAGGWRPHVTIQNKVAPKVARGLIARSAPISPRVAGHRRLGSTAISGAVGAARPLSFRVSASCSDVAQAPARHWFDLALESLNYALSQLERGEEQAMDRSLDVHCWRVADGRAAPPR